MKTAEKGSNNYEGVNKMQDTENIKHEVNDETFPVKERLSSYENNNAHGI